MARGVAWRVVVVAAGAAFASAVLLKFAPVPYAWIAFVWSATAVFAAVLARRVPVRGLLVGAATVTAAVGLGEVAFALMPVPAPVRRQITPPYLKPDSILGWRLIAGTFRDVEHVGDTLIYDVTYVVDSAGRRIVPSPPAGVESRCVWFFGCSFGFGPGVPDSATMPFRLATHGGSSVELINFSTSGYGPEHMLAAVERGIAQRESPCSPSVIVYQAIPHHVLRAAGRTSISAAHPQYALGADGTPTYRGTALPGTGRALNEMRDRVRYNLRKSAMYARLSGREPLPSPRDVALYTAIVRRSRDLLAAQYPDASFNVLLWSQNEQFGGDFSALQDSLRSVTPRLYVVDDAITDYRSAQEKYRLHPRDNHPNAVAYDRFAAYAAPRILGRR